MWYRRVIGNTSDIDPLSGKTAKRGFAPGTDTTNDHVHLFYADDSRFVADDLSDLGSGEWRTFLSSRKAEGAGGRPGNRVAILIRKKDLRIVVGSVNMERACDDVLLGDARQRAGFESLIDGSTGFSYDPLFSHILCFLELTATARHGLSYVAADGPRIGL